MSNEFLKVYQELTAIDLGDIKAKQERGRKFEDLLKALLEDEKLEPAIRLRPKGEEVDGSFLLDGRIFLLEAKWHADPLPASALYAFKGKVDGKLIGTVGVFISMSGYSRDAVDALLLGKGLNVLLYDRDDIEAIVQGKSTFVDLLRKKIRAAAEFATVYLRVKSTEIGSKNGDVTVNVNFGGVDSTSAPTESKLIVLCEGDPDEAVLRELVQKILKDKPSTIRVHIAVAGGKRALPRISNTLYRFISPQDRLIFVVDSDGDIKATEQLIRSESLVPDPEIVVIHPEIEAWLTTDSEEAAKLRRRRDLSKYKQLAQEVNLDELAKRDSSFKSFCRLLRKESVGEA